MKVAGTEYHISPTPSHWTGHTCYMEMPGGSKGFTLVDKFGYFEQKDHSFLVHYLNTLKRLSQSSRPSPFRVSGGFSFLFIPVRYVKPPSLPVFIITFLSKRVHELYLKLKPTTQPL